MEKRRTVYPCLDFDDEDPYDEDLTDIDYFLIAFDEFRI